MTCQTCGRHIYRVGRPPECCQITRARIPARVQMTPDDLEVNCWCEQTIVWVHPDLLRAGLTGSCGAHECRPPAVQYPPG